MAMMRRGARLACAAALAVGAFAVGALAACGSTASLACLGCADAAADVDATARVDAGRDATRDTSDHPTDATDTGSAPDSTDDAPGEASADAGADSARDAALDARAEADAGSDGACPGTAGPVPVKIVADAGAFCIDATEVTNDQYARFLATQDGGAPAQPPPCAANASFVPGPNGWPPAAGAGGDPVVAVDWCDAFAYCAWAGKRLCGALRGGATPYDAFADAGASAWFLACSAAGTRTYPYGAAYDRIACNGADYPGANTLRAAGSLPTCTGAYPGVFDLSGNVYEWEDACSGDAGASDSCRIRGGGYFSFAPSLACATDATFARGTNLYADIGFRCCSGAL